MLISALNLANQILISGNYDELRTFAQERIVDARRVMGAEHEITLMLRNLYAQALFNGHDGFDASRDDRKQAVAILIDVVQILRRVMGPSHPQTKNVELCLRNIRGRLALGVYDSLVTNRNSV